MAAYQLEPWSELFVMVGGASAALAGLLFVAVSLNLEHVLKYEALPSFAANSMSLLVAVVIAAVLGLAPAETAVVYGVELLLLGCAVTAMQLIPTIRGLRTLPEDRTRWRVWRVGAALVASLPVLVAGISLMVGAGGGLYWLLAWIVIALVVSTYNAWVLLIEIRR